MAVYTDIPEEAMGNIAKKYELQLFSYAPVKAGWSNSNYLLHTNKGVFMLVLVEDRSLKDVDIHVKLLVWLYIYKFETTKVLPTASGSLFDFFEGKPFFIRTYLKGSVPKKLNNKMLLKLGAAIGKLHQVPVPDFIHDHHFYERTLFSKVLTSGIEPAYETWLTKIVQQIKERLPKKLPSGLIHGDVFMDNVLFNESEEYQAIIDFEQSCAHHFIFDIGMAVIGLCLKNNKIDCNKIKALLEGYQKIRPLLSIEKQNLKYYIVYAAAKTSNWHFWKYHFQSPNPKNQARQKELTLIANNIWKIPDEVFIEKYLTNSSSFLSNPIQNDKKHKSLISN